MRLFLLRLGLFLSKPLFMAQSCAGYLAHPFEKLVVFYERMCQVASTGESCLRRFAWEIRLRRRSLDQSRSALFSRHRFSLFLVANLSANPYLSTPHDR